MIILKSDAAIEIDGVVTVWVGRSDIMGNSATMFISCANNIDFITKASICNAAKVRTRGNSCHVEV
jgi:hypothetical protein